MTRTEMASPNCLARGVDHFLSGSRSWAFCSAELRRRGAEEDKLLELKVQVGFKLAGALDAKREGALGRQNPRPALVHSARGTADLILKEAENVVSYLCMVFVITTVATAEDGRERVSGRRMSELQALALGS